MIISKCRCCSKSLSKTSFVNAEGPSNLCCSGEKLKTILQNLSMFSAKHHQIRTIYSVREPTFYWYDALGATTKEQAKGLRRKVSDLLNVVKNELRRNGPQAELDNGEFRVSLCSRTIPATEIPSRYKNSLRPSVGESDVIRESNLMAMPSKSKDIGRLMALREVEENIQAKRKFANSLHPKNVSGMTLRSDGITYYINKPQFFPTSDLYEVPGLKTDLLKIKVPHKVDKEKNTQKLDSDFELSNIPQQKIYFTPKRLRRYPD